MSDHTRLARQLAEISVEMTATDSERAAAYQLRRAVNALADAIEALELKLATEEVVDV